MLELNSTNIININNNIRTSIKGIQNIIFNNTESKLISFSVKNDKYHYFIDIFSKIILEKFESIDGINKNIVNIIYIKDVYENIYLYNINGNTNKNFLNKLIDYTNGYDITLYLNDNYSFINLNIIGDIIEYSEMKIFINNNFIGWPINDILFNDFISWPINDILYNDIAYIIRNITGIFLRKYESLSFRSLNLNEKYEKYRNKGYNIYKGNGYNFLSESDATILIGNKPNFRFSSIYKTSWIINITYLSKILINLSEFIYENNNNCNILYSNISLNYKKNIELLNSNLIINGERIESTYEIKILIYLENNPLFNLDLIITVIEKSLYLIDNIIELTNNESNFIIDINNNIKIINLRNYYNYIHNEYLSFDYNINILNESIKSKINISKC